MRSSESNSRLSVGQKKPTGARRGTLRASEALKNMMETELTSSKSPTPGAERRASIAGGGLTTRASAARNSVYKPAIDLAAQTKKQEKDLSSLYEKRRMSTSMKSVSPMGKAPVKKPSTSTSPSPMSQTLKVPGQNSSMFKTIRGKKKKKGTKKKKKIPGAPSEFASEMSSVYDINASMMSSPLGSAYDHDESIASMTAFINDQIEDGQTLKTEAAHQLINKVCILMAWKEAFQQIKMHALSTFPPSSKMSEHAQSDASSELGVAPPTIEVVEPEAKPVESFDPYKEEKPLSAEDEAKLVQFAEVPDASVPRKRKSSHKKRRMTVAPKTIEIKLDAIEEQQNEDASSIGGGYPKQQPVAAAAKPGLFGRFNAVPQARERKPFLDTGFDLNENEADDNIDDIKGIDFSELQATTPQREHRPSSAEDDLVLQKSASDNEQHQSNIFSPNEAFSPTGIDKPSLIQVDDQEKGADDPPSPTFKALGSEPSDLIQPKTRRLAPMKQNNENAEPKTTFNIDEQLKKINAQIESEKGGPSPLGSESGPKDKEIHVKAKDKLEAMFSEKNTEERKPRGGADNHKFQDKIARIKALSSNIGKEEPTAQAEPSPVAATSDRAARMKALKDNLGKATASAAQPQAEPKEETRRESVSLAEQARREFEEMMAKPMPEKAAPVETKESQPDADVASNTLNQIEALRAKRRLRKERSKEFEPERHSTVPAELPAPTFVEPEIQRQKTQMLNDVYSNAVERQTKKDGETVELNPLDMYSNQTLSASNAQKRKPLSFLNNESEPLSDGSLSALRIKEQTLMRMVRVSHSNHVAVMSIYLSKWKRRISQEKQSFKSLIRIRSKIASTDKKQSLKLGFEAIKQKKQDYLHEVIQEELTNIRDIQKDLLDQIGSSIQHRRNKMMVIKTFFAMKKVYNDNEKKRKACYKLDRCLSKKEARILRVNFRRFAGNPDLLSEDNLSRRSASQLSSQRLAPNREFEKQLQKFKATGKFVSVAMKKQGEMDRLAIWRVPQLFKKWKAFSLSTKLVTGAFPDSPKGMPHEVSTPSSRRFQGNPFDENPNQSWGSPQTNGGDKESVQDDCNEEDKMNLFPDNSTMHKSPANLRYKDSLNPKNELEEDVSSVELDSDDSCFETQVNTQLHNPVVKHSLDFSIGTSGQFQSVKDHKKDIGSVDLKVQTAFKSMDNNTKDQSPRIFALTIPKEKGRGAHKPFSNYPRERSASPLNVSMMSTSSRKPGIPDADRVLGSFKYPEEAATEVRRGIHQTGIDEPVKKKAGAQKKKNKKGGFGNESAKNDEIKSLTSQPSVHPADDEATLSSLLRRKPNQLPKDVMPFASTLADVLDRRTQEYHIEFFIGLCQIYDEKVNQEEQDEM